jgi:hypothetical protein
VTNPSPGPHLPQADQDSARLLRAGPTGPGREGVAEPSLCRAFSKGQAPAPGPRLQSALPIPPPPTIHPPGSAHLDVDGVQRHHRPHLSGARRSSGGRGRSWVVTVASRVNSCAARPPAGIGSEGGAEGRDPASMATLRARPPAVWKSECVVAGANGRNLPWLVTAGQGQFTVGYG